MDTWEKLDLGLVMTVLGMGIVFLVLIFLTQLIGLFERFFGARKGPAAGEQNALPPDTTRERGASAPRPSPAPAAAPAAPQQAPPAPQPAAAAAPAVRPAVVAAVMAAVSAYLQSEALVLAPPVRRLPDDLSFWGRAARLEQMMSRRL